MPEAPCRLLAGVLSLLAAMSAALPSSPAHAQDGAPAAGPVAGSRAKERLRGLHGAGEAARIDRGVGQAARLWRAEDGDGAAFEAFCVEEFLPTGPRLDALFDRLEFAFERIDGFFNSMQRDLRRGADLDLGPIQPIDERLAGWDVSAHVTDDLFANRIAFLSLLNFPVTSLAERMEKGPSWSRRRWAEARLAGRFATRVPASVQQRMARASADADAYIARYDVMMHHLLDEDGGRPFPPGLRLISHWGLRDELKARYAETGGLSKQRMIQLVMERIVRQEIPASVIGDPRFDWTPATNAVVRSPIEDGEPPARPLPEDLAAREPDTRYAHWLAIFQAQTLADRFDPECPSLVARRFERDREIPEEIVRGLFEEILDSPLSRRVADLVAQRLGRPLEPFDIWYAGFKPRGKHAEADLDRIVRERYPSAAAYASDIPRLLRDLGFSAEKARFLAEHIEVEPSRGAGHALGGQRRDDKAHLRTRVGEKGMDYKGYNIAVHEMGHNVEQVFSMVTIDHTLLEGVPNTAFTEALAFVFQSRDLELLGLEKPGPESEHLRALEDFWATREIAGVALVDMAAWRWLYEHPDADAAAFREAVVAIANDLWNRSYAALLGGRRDVPILAIYSHMIDGAMYTPDYPLGHLIAFQVDRYFREAKSLGDEFERVTRIGSLTPDAWMRQAVGAPLSAKPLLEAAARALEALAPR